MQQEFIWVKFLFLERKTPVLPRDVQSIDSNHGAFIDNVNFKTKNDVNSNNLSTKNIKRLTRKSENQSDEEIGKILFILLKKKSLVWFYSVKIQHILNILIQNETTQ